MADLVVTDVRFKPAAPGADNLVGFATCTVGQLSLSVLVVRVRDGLRVVFPKREDRNGRRHAVVRPVTERARVAIEQAILAAIEVQS